MKFDLTNLFDLATDPLSRYKLKKDFDQEVYERVLGNQVEPVKQAVVLEVIPPAPKETDNPSDSNEQFYAIRARIENLHESLPDPVEFIKQKKTNAEINKLIDMSRIIYSLRPVASNVNEGEATQIPQVGDVVELVQVSNGVYRFDKKTSTVGDLIGFTKNEDPSQMDQPAVVDPNSAQNLHANGTPFVGASGQAATSLVDQNPVLAAAKRGDFYENRGLPCSGFVAIWVFNQLGLIPEQKDWSDWKAWSRKDLTLWNIINIVRDKDGNKGKVGDTFNITGIQERLGGTIQHYSESQTLPKPGPGPALTVGRWHISQRWCPTGKSGGLPSGHIYLVYWDGGEKVKFIDSSHKKKYRDMTLPKNSWWGGGCSETVLTLPIGAQNTSSKTAGNFSNIIQELESKVPIKTGLIASIPVSGLTGRVLQEYALWNGKIETDPTMYEVLKKYWDNIQYASWTPSGTPWSASFISWIVGDSTFPKSSAHRLYAEDALKNRIINAGNWHLFSLIRETPIVTIGDVMVKARSGKYTNSHGDIVWKIENNKAYLAGGNLGETMKNNIIIGLNTNGTVSDPKEYKIILKKVK